MQLQFEDITFSNLKYEAENLSNNSKTLSKNSEKYLLKTSSVPGTVLTTFQGLSHFTLTVTSFGGDYYYFHFTHEVTEA